MNAALIAKWNARVGEGDLVYHLGDFAWGDRGPYGRPHNENFLG
jgi:calcineurin-like phosphoesterase family protein